MSTFKLPPGVDIRGPYEKQLNVNRLKKRVEGYKRERSTRRTGVLDVASNAENATRRDGYYLWLASTLRVSD